MMLRACPRDKEVKELVERGQWPVAAATAPELRAHVDGCRSCGDLVLVAMAFQNARAEAAGEGGGGVMHRNPCSKMSESKTEGLEWPKECGYSSLVFPLLRTIPIAATLEPGGDNETRVVCPRITAFKSTQP